MKPRRRPKLTRPAAKEEPLRSGCHLTPDKPISIQEARYQLRLHASRHWRWALQRWPGTRIIPFTHKEMAAEIQKQIDGDPDAMPEWLFRMCST